MALISQSVKNLKGGISQQPDILRYPEQGSVQVNGWSSETEGLQKRPPLVFNKPLGDSNVLGASPFIHLINRDEFEQYYVAFTGSGIKVFDLEGNAKTVTGNTAYANTQNPREDLRCVTVADYTFVVNRKTTVKANLNDKYNGGTFRDKGDALINVRGSQYGRTIKVVINGTERVHFTLDDGAEPFHAQSISTDKVIKYIVEQLQTGKVSAGEDSTGRFGVYKYVTTTPLPQSWSVVAGDGYVHITAPAGEQIDSITTADGYGDQLVWPVTHYVQSFSKLPLTAPEGYMVKIVGSAESTGDQYYVQYSAERKVWSECPGWNIAKGLQNSTMPHALVRKADGNFEFKELSYSQRKAGDDETNDWPSFVDNTINDVFFFRNRLGFLSGENIILSRTAKYFNFFPASVATLSDDDPIDVAVSFNRISILKYAVPFAEELLLWSDEAQFVLTAAGILSSKSVELNLVTQFDVQDKARPYGIGRSVYFASPRATFTSINRYYAVQDVSAVKNAEDMTSHVPNYIPNGVFSIAGSATENFCSVLTSGAPSRIYIYKFLFIDEQVRQQSWSHWEFGANVKVLAANSIGSRMHLILQNQYNTFSATVSFTKDTVDFEHEPYRLYMDVKKHYQIPAGTYNDDLYQTSIRLDTIYGMNFGNGRVTVVEEDGKITEIEAPVGGWKSDPTIRLTGNLEGAHIFIGFNIPFRYEFSKFLIKKTAEDGSIATEDIGRLQLRRAWINYEESGAFTIQVENQSRVFSYEMAGARLGASNLRANRLNVGTGQYKFPVVGNAVNNTVRLISDNTTPLNIIGCGWEGNYIRRSSGI